MYQSKKYKSTNTQTESILQEAERIVNGSRQQDYGDTDDSFTIIAKGWSILIGKELTSEQVGLMMVWLKMARQVNKPKRDNLVDIAGYAECISRLKTH